MAEEKKPGVFIGARHVRHYRRHIKNGVLDKNAVIEFEGLNAAQIERLEEALVSVGFLPKIEPRELKEGEMLEAATLAEGSTAVEVGDTFSAPAAGIKKTPIKAKAGGVKRRTKLK